MKYSGIDLHSNNCVVSVTDEEDRVVAENRLPDDLAKILGFLMPWREQLAGIVVESTFNWYWLGDGLQAAGFKVHRAHTTAIRRYEGLKHSGDEADARYLAHLLRRGILPTGRWLRHVFMPPWAWRRAFTQSALDAIEAAIRASEIQHGGEIRFAIENRLVPSRVSRGLMGRERAVEVFSNLRVWDTEHNSGVLIYLLLADRDIEIVADRGIAARVAPDAWESVAKTTEEAFRQGEFEREALAGTGQVSTPLAAHFPPAGHNPNELSNRPGIVPRGRD